MASKNWMENLNTDKISETLIHEMDSSVYIHRRTNEKVDNKLIQGILDVVASMTHYKSFPLAGEIVKVGLEVVRLFNIYDDIFIFDDRFEMLMRVFRKAVLSASEFFEKNEYDPENPEMVKIGDNILYMMSEIYNHLNCGYHILEDAEVNTAFIHTYIGQLEEHMSQLNSFQHNNYNANDFLEKVDDGFATHERSCVNYTIKDMLERMSISLSHSEYDTDDYKLIYQLLSEASDIPVNLAFIENIELFMTAFYFSTTVTDKNTHGVCELMNIIHSYAELLQETYHTFFIMYNNHVVQLSETMQSSDVCNFIGKCSEFFMI